MARHRHPEGARARRFRRGLRPTVFPAALAVTVGAGVLVAPDAPSPPPVLTPPPAVAASPSVAEALDLERVSALMRQEEAAERLHRLAVTRASRAAAREEVARLQAEKEQAAQERAEAERRAAEEAARKAAAEEAARKAAEEEAARKEAARQEAAARQVSAAITNSLGPVRPHVQAAADAVVSNVPGAAGMTIGGTRSGAVDPNGHPAGLALDFMTGSDAALGDAVAQYLIANAAQFRVSYVIWQQRIFTVGGSGWEWMEDRGSATANHYDHPHVTFHP